MIQYGEKNIRPYRDILIITQESMMGWLFDTCMHVKGMPHIGEAVTATLPLSSH